MSEYGHTLVGVLGPSDRTHLAPGTHGLVHWANNRIARHARIPVNEAKCSTGLMSEGGTALEHLTSLFSYSRLMLAVSTKQLERCFGMSGWRDP